MLFLVSTFTAVLQNISMIIFLSLKCFTVYFSKEIFIEYLKTFPLEMGKGHQKGMSIYAMGGRSCVRVHTMGEGVKFLSFFCVRTN